MTRPFRIIGDVAAVTLTRGKEVIIDLADLPLVQVARWHAYQSSNTWYARGRPEPWPKPELQLHTWLMKPPRGFLIDHRDGDGLNCRRGNMRLANKSQNTANRFREQPNATGFRGIRLLPSGRYQAAVTLMGRRIALGTYATPEEAYQAYCEGARKYHGEFASFK